MNKLQLTLQQHGFELGRSTYTWILTNKYIVPYYRIRGWLNLQIHRNCACRGLTVKLYVDSQLRGGCSRVNCTWFLWVSVTKALIFLELCRLRHFTSALSNTVVTAISSFWALEMWRVQIDMCCKCKIHTGFWRLSMKKYSSLITFFCWLHVEMAVFCTHWIK